MAAGESKTALLQGSLDMLILRTLSGGPQHGYAVARHLHRASGDFLQVEEGSLYPALHRLARRGWLAAEWGTSESNRRAKFYRLTPAGKKQLQAETAAWQKISQAIGLVLRARPAESF